jgi:hypothetical protein
MSTATRIYVVRPNFGASVWHDVDLKNYPPDRLIRAANAAQAARHAIRNGFVVELASQNDLVDLVSTGTPVETAGAESANTDAEEL